jgi:starch phosphorylase
MTCADFDAFVGAMNEAADLYRSPQKWSRRALFNIVGGSSFTSDATIRAYARDIWKIVPVRADLAERTSRAAMASGDRPGE